LEQTARLIGNDAVIAALAAGEEPDTIRQQWKDPVERFRRLRARHLLY